MFTFEVNYTGGDRLRNVLNGLNEAFSKTDHRSILQQIGQLYLDETDNRFTKGYDVDRKKWKPLKPSTIRLKGHDTVGHKTTNLRRSVKMDFVGNSVFIGTNSPYAKTFHYSVKKGKFRRASPGVQAIPWGDIPARSFIGRNKRIDGKAITLLRKILIQQFGLDKSFVNENFK